MEILTPRLRLRDVREGDAAALDAYHADPAYRRYYERVPETGPFLAMLRGWARERPRYRFQLAIARLEEDTLLGTCGLRKPSVRATEAEFGCELDPRFWGRGYAREAGSAILQHGFAELGLTEVWARCHPANRAAHRLAESLGFTWSGESAAGGERLYRALSPPRRAP